MLKSTFKILNCAYRARKCTCRL